MDAPAWTEGRFAVLDLETTSPVPTLARLVSVAVGMVGAGRPTEQFTSLVDSGVEIPQEAIDIHGITQEQAAGGIMGREAVAWVSELLEARPEGAPVVAFNAAYDLTVLDREARRYDIRPLGTRGRALHVVCPRILDLFLDKYRPGKRKLTEMCELWGVNLDGAHDAMFDALAAGRLAHRIVRHGQVRRRVRDESEARELEALQAQFDAARGSLALLHQEQRVWAREAAESFEKLIRTRYGDTQRFVPKDWPVYELTPTEVFA